MLPHYFGNSEVTTLTALQMKLTGRLRWIVARWLESKLAGALVQRPRSNQSCCSGSDLAELPWLNGLLDAQAGHYASNLSQPTSYGVISNPWNQAFCASTYSFSTRLWPMNWCLSPTQSFQGRPYLHRWIYVSTIADLMDMTRLDSRYPT